MDELEITRSKSTVEVRLDRASRANALSGSLVETLLELVDECARDGTRLLVFSGKGPHFCAGFDLGDLDRQTDGDLLWRLERLRADWNRVWWFR
jgi:enoyl-CoA hydratase